ncbi:MAG TPA: hypothetical protein VKI61_14575, partial [Chitinophagaceae bacterium]|nr:hypothetical protein [Chitinophagaceae bacterium]
KLKESIYVEQVMVVGAERKFAGALIVPSFSNLRDWCKQNNIAYTTDSEIIRNPAVVAMFKELVESYNKYFSHVEQIKKFELLQHEWGIDTGEMTPKMSIKRKVVEEKYRHAIERIYA